MKKGLIILISAIVLLGGLVLVLNFLDNGKTENAEEKSESSVSMMNFNSEVTEYTVENSQGKFSFYKNGSKWMTDISENIELDQNYVTTSVAKASFLYAQSLIKENADNLSEFGFDEPTATVKLTGSDGSTAKITFGRTTATGSGYYAVVGDSKDIYIVSSDNFNKIAGSLNSYRVKELFSVNADEVTGIEIKSSDYDIVIQQKTDTNKNAGNFSSWTMVSPYKKDVNTNIFEENVLNKLNFDIVDYIDDNPSDYGQYGLGNPKHEIKISTEKSDFVIQLGNDADTNSVYARLPGRPNVYTISKDSVEYRDYTPVYLLESLAFSRNITATDSIEFISDKKYNMSVTDGKYYMNGIQVDENAYKQVFRTLISSVISGEVDSTRVGNRICSYTFNYNTGTKSETVGFYEYGDMYAAVSVDGKTEFYVKRSYVDDMIKAVTDLAEKKEFYEQ